MKVMDAARAIGIVVTDGDVSGTIDERKVLTALTDLLCRADSDLTTQLTELLAGDEVAATVARCESLLRVGRMPVPASGRPSIPWPAF